MHRRYERHFNDVDKTDIVIMGLNGFSARGIAEVVAGIPAASNSRSAALVRNAVRHVLHANKVKLREWRDVATRPAQAQANRITRGRHQRRKAG